MYMFEIHKDSKILHSKTHLSKGFLFSSASPFPYSFDLKLPKMKTKSSG